MGIIILATSEIIIIEHNTGSGVANILLPATKKNTIQDRFTLTDC
jgi:hypothetical protein